MAIQIASTIDREGNIFLRVAAIGTTTLSIETLKETYVKHLKKTTAICTDGLFAYRKLSESRQLEYHAFVSHSKEKRGIYHINHINYVHSMIRSYLYRHPGISSKYLNEYLALIAYNIQHKVQNVHDNFINIFKCECGFRRAHYISISLDFICNSLG